MRCQGPDSNKEAKTGPGVLGYVGGIDRNHHYPVAGGEPALQLGSDTGSNVEAKARSGFRVGTRL